MAYNGYVAVSDGHGYETAGKRTPALTEDLYINGKLVRKKGETIRENEFNAPTADYLIAALKRNNFKVLHVSPTNKDISLKERVKKANDAKVDLYVSKHYNALGSKWQTKASGVVTIVSKGCSSKSKKVAGYVHEEIMKVAGGYSYGVKYDKDISGYSLYELSKTNMPALLTESGFMDYLPEAKRMLDPEFQKKDAEATCKGICKYFGVTYIPPTNDKVEESAKPSTDNKSVFVVGAYNKAVKVTADVLNVRDGRGSDYKKIGTLKKGDVVTVWTIDKAKDGSLWGSFRYNPEYIGYIHMGYVEPTIVKESEPVLKPIAEGDYDSKLKVTADVLNVRIGRGSKFNKIGTLKKGQVITGWVIKKGDDGNLWVSFRYDAKNVGFCSCKYLEPTK